MAMTMNGQVQLAASRDVVWAKLNDPEVLKSCIPGSEQLDKISDSEFQAIQADLNHQLETKRAQILGIERGFAVVAKAN